MKLNNTQKRLLEELGISENDNEAVIEEAVSDCLQLRGFDENYHITDIGRLCEEILDMLEV